MGVIERVSQDGGREGGGSERRSRWERLAGRVVLVPFLALLVGASLGCEDTPTVPTQAAQRTGIPPSTTTPLPAGMKLTSAQNNVLWSMADAALTRFIAFGVLDSAAGTQRPATSVAAENGQARNEFGRALANLKSVVPPPEQEKLHRALLPLYEEMDDAMMSIMVALVSNDRSTVEVQRERLEMLVEEAGALVRALDSVSAPKSSGQVLYRDDFKDPKSGFPESLRDDDSVIGYGAGYYELRLVVASGTQAQSKWVGAWRTKEGFGDFDMEVDVSLVESKRDGMASLLFRLTDENNYWKLGVDPVRQLYQFYKLKNNQQQQRKDGSSTAIKQGTTSNRLKVVAKGQTITAYVNGVELASSQDEANGHGFVGFSLNAWSDPIAARFSNLVVAEVR